MPLLSGTPGLPGGGGRVGASILREGPRCPFGDSLEKHKVKKIGPTLTLSERKGLGGEGEVSAEV